MFKFLFKKKENNKDKTRKFGYKIKEKANNFANFLGEKIKDAQEELLIMRHKFSNLLETNYNLGIKHLTNGNLTDAIFRFRFIIKFWPHCHDAYYQLAYCLLLNKREVKAKKILLTLLEKNPNYGQKAYDLLEKIENELNSIS